MKLPKLSTEEDRIASNEIMGYYNCPGQEHEHGELIDYYFSDLIKGVLDDTLDLEGVLSSRTEDERIIIKKLIRVTLEKSKEDNESGYFGVRQSYDFDGDNWHYIDEIKAFFDHIEFFHAETLKELEKEVKENNCLWVIVDKTAATKTRIKDAKLRREKENAYDEQNYVESFEIHPRYAVKFVRDYYESTSKYGDLIEEIFSKDCMNAIYSNTFDMDSFLTSGNPMERAIVRLLVPFINNRLYSDVGLNDTGIFGVKTAYGEEGSNWIYDDLLRGYFDHPNRIYAETLEELKGKVLKDKGIWFVLDENLEKRSLKRDEEIQQEKRMIKNPPSQARGIVKNIIKESFSKDNHDSYCDLVREIHTSKVMESIIGKSSNFDGLLYSCDIIGRIIIRMSVQKMKDALSFARMNNYVTGYFGVTHLGYDDWIYVDLVEREYFGEDECDVICGSSLKELEGKVKSYGNKIWCIFDEENAEKLHEMDMILLNSSNKSLFASIEDYWDSLRNPSSKNEITAAYIERLIEKNKKREGFMQIKEEERIKREKEKQLEDKLHLGDYKLSRDIKRILSR